MEYKPHLRMISRFVAPAVVLLLIFAGAASGQRRDHLTREEIKLVKDVQQIDLRMELFVKAINRRFLAIKGPASLGPDEQKALDKDRERWGELPTGSKSALLAEIDKILDEAISKIEDVAEREVKSELFPAAVYVLADNCRIFINRLETLADKASNARDEAVINSSVSQCRDILEASAKVKRPDPKKRKKKKRKAS